MARVRITKLPKALSGLEMKMSAGLYGKGTNGNPQFRKSSYLEAGKISQQPTEVRDTLQPVAREGANLEAEKGETAMVNIDGIPAHFKIGGKRHSQGGTPLNLPDNSFIFSDTAKMKIKDPIMLAQFGMVPKKSGYTPAEIAKKYDINKLRQVLADPNTDDLERKTAELMISNYNMKLAKLALLQESSKGFPQGIPVVAMPYIMATGMNPEEFAQMGTQGEEEEPDADMGEQRYGGNIISQFNTKQYGGLPTAQTGRPVTPGFGAPLIRKTEGEFASKYPAIYNAYMQALNSNDPKLMQERANLIESQQTSIGDLFKGTKKQTPWYSFDIIPGTDADMFENLATVLREKSKQIKTQSKYKPEVTKDAYKDLPVKALGVYGQLKKQYDAIPDTDYMAKIDVDNKLKLVESLLPANKARYLPSKVKEPWQIYSREDLGIINTMFDEVFKPAQTSVLVEKPKENKPKEEVKEEEVATTTPAVETKSDKTTEKKSTNKTKSETKDLSFLEGLEDYELIN